ncbi:hypothetical protein [Streptomyces sp. NBC_01446]|uniref:hypothetical protein n=1 Tax=Streptomyces sp. NBC_01446 TaxID=2903870 RepID=UPI00224FAD00|nr:hypothetical protein [Streptomyces sp. NBC_01446]
MVLPEYNDPPRTTDAAQMRRSLLLSVVVIVEVDGVRVAQGPQPQTCWEAVKL